MYRIARMGLLALASLYLLSLLSYDPSDPSWFFVDTSRREVHNLFGRWGATVASFSFQYLNNQTFFLYLCAGVLISSGLFLGSYMLHALANTSPPSAPDISGESPPLRETNVSSSVHPVIEHSSLEAITPSSQASLLSEYPQLAETTAPAAANPLLEHLYLDRPHTEGERRWIEREELLRNSERWLQSRKKR